MTKERNWNVFCLFLLTLRLQYLYAEIIRIQSQNASQNLSNYVPIISLHLTHFDHQEWAVGKLDYCNLTAHG